jgi:predicted small lipoprotein YifL
MLSRLPLWLVIASTALAMAVGSGCGVRGPLETPPKSIADAPPTKPGEPTPHKSSILDPLIR